MYTQIRNRKINPYFLNYRHPFHVPLNVDYHKMNRTKVIVSLVANLIFSIAIVLLNKWIYVHGKFPNITLSMIHFVVTFLGLCVCERLDVFSIKSIHLDQILVLAICFCGFVVFTNLSLEYNSVGTYQVAKMLTTPGVMLIQGVYYKKQFPTSVILTTIPVIVGVAICFLNDVYFNVKGTIFALLGVCITSFYQVFVNSKQAELRVDAMQLLYYQAPLSAALLCFCIPVFEPSIYKILDYKWTLLEIAVIPISGVIAFFVNLTIYWIIGNTSPLSYNMLGHMKFVLITVGCWYLYDENVTLNQAFGIALTLIGVLLYTYVKMSQQALQQTAQRKI